jgi:hypothetical protein
MVTASLGRVLNARGVHERNADGRIVASIQLRAGSFISIRAPRASARVISPSAAGRCVLSKRLTDDPYDPYDPYALCHPLPPRPAHRFLSASFNSRF